jgi:D-alanyl-D-alanine carboxypeptidase
MNDSKPARTAARPTRSTILIALAVVIAAIIAALGYQLLAASSSLLTHDPRARPIPVAPATIARQADDVRRRRPPRHLLPIDHLHGDHPGAPDEADGALPDGVTVFDAEYPGVANLDPALLQALREAATDAADDGVTFSITSGWRSPEYQHQLLREAVSVYGSEEEAARWVATADTSAHVSGDAIDIGHDDATAWLSAHGTVYGLCQIYSNEPWHFELRPEAIDHGCPPMYADPTHDPGMRP